LILMKNAGHKVNSDLEYFTPIMPVPEFKKGLPYRFNEYSEVPDEPKFNPAVHLVMDTPQYVTRLPDYKRVKSLEGEEPGRLAYCQPVQFLSEEGVRVMRNIVKREQDPKGAATRGTRVSLRGLYYRSPWVRDLANSEEVLDYMSSIAGERLVPSHMINSMPQVNASVPGMTGATEFWHWDSISYVANFLLNDTDEMEGGDLEIIRMEKRAGMKALVEGSLPTDAVEKLVYGPPGSMVMAQGSEILHHVTPMKSKFSRVVAILCFAPANVYRPDKMSLYADEQEDRAHGWQGITAYEFFRGKSWVCGQALTGMASKVPHTENRKKLAERLRSVVHELERVADILEEKTTDIIGHFDEDNKKHAAKYNIRHGTA